MSYMRWIGKYVLEVTFCVLYEVDMQVCIHCFPYNKYLNFGTDNYNKIILYYYF